MANFADPLWAEIRKEFGEHSKRRRDYKTANENFEASLQYHPEKLESVYRLTNSQAREANLDEGLQLLNEKSGLDGFKHHLGCNLQECDNFYENNEFEESMLRITDKARRYQNAVVHIPHTTTTKTKQQDEARKKGPKVLPLANRFEMVRMNYDDMIGKNAGNCLYNQRKHFENVMQKWKPHLMPSTVNRVESKSEADCDVVSVDEGKIQNKSVREKYRQETLSRKFAQCYLQSAWKGYDFLKSLKTNKTLLESTQNVKSFNTIMSAIDDGIKIDEALIHQLHARSPMYTQSNKMFTSPKQKEKVDQTRKFRLQYQTRREMFKALDEMNDCRAKGELKKLIKIADHELGYHYEIKPDCLMPRKKEFATEICNLIGLAHVDKLKLPSNYNQLNGLEQLAAIFKVSFSNKNAAVPYVFGDQSTYRDVGMPDVPFLLFKENINRLEERLKYSKMTIEKCHLYHEMGKQNLAQKKIDETRSFARKLIEEAVEADSYLWKFLGHILICKADVLQKNAIKINESLKAAKEMVDIFKLPELNEFVTTSLEICQEIF